MTSSFSIIVAVDAAGGIGKDGGIPWRLSPDMRYFKAVTLGPGALTNAVIMGRRTWDSIPLRFRPLPGRLNIVLSRTPDALDLPPGVRAAGSLDAALSLAAGHAQRFVIGGGAVYAEALQRPDCRSLAVTRLAGDFECDTTFPPIPAAFTLAHETPPRDHDGLAYRFQRWVRHPTPS